MDIESSAPSDNPAELSNLEHYTLRANDPSRFPIGALSVDAAHRLESIGRRIWNTFLRKQDGASENEDGTTNVQYCLRARLFGYLLIGIGLLGRPDANGTQTAAYLIRLGLSLSKTCINLADLDSARIALQKVAEYLPSNPCGGASADGGSPTSSQADFASYYILRIALVRA